LHPRIHSDHRYRNPERKLSTTVTSDITFFIAEMVDNFVPGFNRMLLLIEAKFLKMARVSLDSFIGFLNNKKIDKLYPRTQSGANLL